MRRVSLDDVTSDAVGSDSDRRRLADPLDASQVALNHYRIAPGEGFPGGLHAHADQEEVFAILAGEATFETFESGEMTVEAGGVIRFAPGEFQSGRNDADEPLVALAVGAPRESEDVRIPVACPDCDHREVRLAFGDGGATFVCPDCGARHVPQDCPDCGGELRVTLADESEANDGELESTAERPTTVVCEECGSEFAKPPLG